MGQDENKEGCELGKCQEELNGISEEVNVTASPIWFPHLRPSHLVELGLRAQLWER